MTDNNLFNSEAFEQMPGQMSMEQVEPTFKGTDAPKFWGEMLTDTRELASTLDELADRDEIRSWRPASDLESRSLWRVIVRLSGCEQRLTEDGAWTLVRNCRGLRS